MPPVASTLDVPPGTIRSDRHAADPTQPGIEVEDPQLSTFLQQFLKLAGQFRLHAPGATPNAPEATWADLFYRSVLFILADIQGTLDQAHAVEKAWSQYQAATAWNARDRADAVSHLVQLTLDMAGKGLAWEDQLIQPSVARAFPEVHDILVGHVRNLLHPSLAHIDDLVWAACRRFQIPLPSAGRDPTIATRFQNILPSPRDPVPLPNDPDGMARTLRDIANSLVRASAQLRSHAPELLERCLRSPRHPPHIALVVAFHAMLREALVQLNRVGPRHLAHHYRDVLGLVPRPHVPDRTWLAFQADPKGPPTVLPSGTLFLAGNSPAGLPLRYRLERDTLVQPVSLQFIAALRAIPARENDPQPDGWITAFAQRASVEGARPSLHPPGEPWPPFGPVPSAPVPPPTSDRQGASLGPRPTDVARIGIDFASPVPALTSPVSNVAT